MNRDELFPKEIQLEAQHAQRSTHCPACVTLAQWALESDYGQYLSGKNNPFGIKGRPGTLCHTWEEINGKAVKTEAYFKDFSTLQEAFEYHGHMLTRPDGYYKAAPFEKDWQAFVKHIAPIYATDPDYANKLIKIIEANKLYEIDLSG